MLKNQLALHIPATRKQEAFIIFLEKGYYRTNIFDIQKDLDMVNATLYHHFANKEELLFAISDKLLISAISNLK